MFSVVHTVSIPTRLSGESPRFRSVWVFSRFPVEHGSTDNSIGTLASLDSGLRTAARQNAESKGAPSGRPLRSDARGTHSRAGDRVLRMIPSVLYFPFPLFRMETNNKSKDTTKAEAESPAIAPVKVCLIGDVSASVFAREVNTKSGPRTFHSVSFSRSFIDSKGVRRYVKTFNVEDLGTVVQVAQQADQFIRSLAA